MKPIDKLLRRLVLAAFVGASLFLATKNGTSLFSVRAASLPKLNVENAPVARENRPELSSHCNCQEGGDKDPRFIRKRSTERRVENRNGAEL